MKYSDFVRLIAFAFLILSGCARGPQGPNLPMVMVSYPPNGAFVKDTVIIRAEAVDNVEIKKVGFYVDGESVAEDADAPYSCEWYTGGLSGAHTIFAKAWDNEDNCGLSNLVNVNIIDTTDNEPPQIVIVSPAPGATVSGTVEVLTEVSDNVGVAKVLFFIDGDSVFTDTVAPFSFSWNTTTYTNGPHTVLAKAFDFSENWANSMITVKVWN